MSFNVGKVMSKSDCMMIGGFVMLGLLCALALTGCTREEVAADLEPPPTPQFVARSAETNSVEQGIDAVPEGHYIYLAWQPSLASDRAGYRVYRQAEDSLEMELIDSLEATQYIDRAAVLAPDQTGNSQGFYYWVSAYDASGNESGLSEEAYYKLLPKPVSLSYNNYTDSLLFSWDYTEALSQVSYFVVRLYQSASDTAFWLETFTQFSDFKVMYYGGLNPGDYRYQVDVVGTSPEDLPSGSEAALQFSMP